jgi:hypothetical protein
MPTRLQLLIARIFVGLFLLFGPFMLVIALISFVRTQIFVHQAIRTTGDILDMEWVKTPGRSRPRYAPEFRFTLQDGRTYMLRSNTFTTWNAFKRGDRVSIVYPIDHPEWARIDTPMQLWLSSIIPAIIGAAFCFIPIVVILRKRRIALAPIT